MTVCVVVLYVCVCMLWEFLMIIFVCYCVFSPACWYCRQQRASVSCAGWIPGTQVDREFCKKQYKPVQAEWYSKNIVLRYCMILGFPKKKKIKKKAFVLKITCLFFFFILITWVWLSMLLSKYKSNVSYLQILQKSCIEILNVEPSSVCVNGTSKSSA